VKHTLSLINEAKVGVFGSPPLMGLKSPYPMSSARMNTLFGFMLST
jgi:hypothetical protein